MDISGYRRDIDDIPQQEKTIFCPPTKDYSKGLETLMTTHTHLQEVVHHPVVEVLGGPTLRSIGGIATAARVPIALALELT